MARPIAYYAADGEKIPSVTGIIGKYKESGGLIHWAWNLGRQGLDYRAVRDEAANSGKLAHSAVEDWVNGRIPTFDGPSQEVREARTAFEAFSQWAEQTRLEITAAETSLISERHRYGGTMDGCLIDHRRAIADWKTGGSIYPEMLCQVAAYGELWNEHYPDDPVTGGYHLCRFDKEGGGFRHYWWPDLSAALEAFLLLRRLYDYDKVLKKLAK